MKNGEIETISAISKISKIANIGSILLAYELGGAKT